MSTIQNFNYDVDVLQLIFWQYDEANVAQLIRQKQESLQRLHTTFWTNWTNDVFNLTTANDFGISVWSIILNLPLLYEEYQRVKIGWGVGPNRLNFNNGNFNITPPLISLLSQQERRWILLMRYRKLTTTGTVTDINKILQFAFNDYLQYGNAYVRDNLNMTISYVFEFTLPAWILVIQQDFNIFPTPEAVGYDFIQSNIMPFDFDFNVDWVLNPLNGSIIDSNTIQTSIIGLSSTIISLPNVMNEFIGKNGTLKITLIAKSVSGSATIQYGYTSTGSPDVLSGDTILNDQEYQTVSFNSVLDPSSTAYEPAFFNPSLAGLYQIQVQAFYIDLLVQ